MRIRDIEQIQERDGGARGWSLGALALAALGGGALVVVAMTTFTPRHPEAASTRDALGELLAEQEVAPAPTTVQERQISFPSTLSDDSTPTTAMATVKDQGGRWIDTAPSDPLAPVGSAAQAAALPSALPPNPVPLGDMMGATSVTREPSDGLSQMAQSRNPDGDVLAPLGREGGYEIQVASFQSKEDAEALVLQLRKRGHSAYRQAAYVPKRGLWHRVRIGPFKSRYEAQRYQQTFEKDERASTFLVDPDKVRRQQSIRDAKARAEEKRQARLNRR